MQHAKHKIHVVNSKCSIVLKEVDVCEFAVKLKIVDESEEPCGTFKNEQQKHLEKLASKRRGKDMELSKLLYGSTRVTFVRGIAGMGKSVLSKQLAYGWANSDMYTEFEVCLMFECREINYFIASAQDGGTKHELIDEFIATKFSYDWSGGERTLFIIDGLDELCDISQGDDSIIWQLLDSSNPKYVRSKFIVTGRPHVERKLFSHQREMGGVRTVEILGLSLDQIEDYVNKFASCEAHIDIINNVKDSSRKALPILHVPQFLNSFCCVAILSNGKKVNNSSELYSWIVYLLLKQHGDKQERVDMRVSEVFKVYSSKLLALCEICHDLLLENQIVFKGDICSCLCQDEKGEEFLEGLFVNVSDNFEEKYEFKHLSLMEFLAAVYICSLKDVIATIKNSLENELYAVVLFSCQLFAGCKYDGIIKDMLTDAAEVRSMGVQEFQPVLESLPQSKNYLDNLNDQLFKFSIDVVMCFINKDVTEEQIIMSIARELLERYHTYNLILETVSKLYEKMVHEYNSNEGILNKEFKVDGFTNVSCHSQASLPALKYFANITHFTLDGVQTSINFIRRAMSQNKKCKEVHIWGCELQDEVVNERAATCQLEKLFISDCKLSRQNIIDLFDWVALSVKVFQVSNLDVEYELWPKLIDPILRRKEETPRDVALTNLWMRNCSTCTAEILIKVTQFIS